MCSTWAGVVIKNILPSWQYCTELPCRQHQVLVNWRSVKRPCCSYEGCKIADNPKQTTTLLWRHKWIWGYYKTMCELQRERECQMPLLQSVSNVLKSVMRGNYTQQRTWYVCDNLGGYNRHTAYFLVAGKEIMNRRNGAVWQHYWHIQPKRLLPFHQRINVRLHVLWGNLI
jgi:hypothetical protein